MIDREIFYADLLLTPCDSALLNWSAWSGSDEELRMPLRLVDGVYDCRFWFLDTESVRVGHAYRVAIQFLRPSDARVALASDPRFTLMLGRREIGRGTVTGGPVRSENRN